MNLFDLPTDIPSLKPPVANIRFSSKGQSHFPLRSDPIQGYLFSLLMFSIQLNFINNTKRKEINGVCAEIKQNLKDSKNQENPYNSVIHEYTRPTHKNIYIIHKDHLPLTINKTNSQPKCK